MSEKTEYTTLFGAKVKEPIEMPDDILQVSTLGLKVGMALTSLTPTTKHFLFHRMRSQPHSRY